MKYQFHTCDNIKIQFVAKVGGMPQTVRMQQATYGALSYANEPVLGEDVTSLWGNTGAIGVEVELICAERRGV